MFLSHAFCPTRSVLSCFESFENYLIEKDNFIGRLYRNIGQQPLFDINIWNQFARIMGNFPRTHSVVEG
ncbi:hypothetical protein HZS_5775 [Henneguya salminicola]|nr:hypothetical protein HZS_5775 [Henneguya salminicola]